MKKILPLVVSLLLCGTSAHAQKSEYLNAQFLSAQTGTTLMAEKPIDMVLQVDLKQSWHTYWKMAGDAGLAPSFDWSGSKNVKEIEVLWPIPQRFEEMGLNSFGYKETVGFPLRIIPEEPGKDITLNLRSEMMVCQNICIPQTLTMLRQFRGGAAATSTYKTQVDAAFEKLPAQENTESLSIDTVILGKEGVVVTARAKDGWSGANDVIIETKNGLLTLPPEMIAQSGDPSLAIFKVPAPQGMDLPTNLFGQSVNVLLIRDGKAIEKNVTF